MGAEAKRSIFFLGFPTCNFLKNSVTEMFRDWILSKSTTSQDFSDISCTFVWVLFSCISAPERLHPDSPLRFRRQYSFLQLRRASSCFHHVFILLMKTGLYHEKK